MIEALARQIAERSRQPIFGVPGSGATLTLLDHLERLGTEFILTHFEASGAIMAATLGRLTGRAGACLSIKGPGLTNMLPGLAVASFEGFPVVAIAEAYGLQVSPAKAHKRIDQQLLTAAVVKGWTQLSASGPSFTELAAIAERQAPGPVLLELASPAPETSPPLVLEGGSLPAVRGDALGLIERAKKPVVIAGTLAIWQDWIDRLNALRVPVFSVAAAKGVVDERSPHAAGVFTGVGLELSAETKIIPEADLVVCLGLRPQEVLATKPFGVPAVNVAAIAEPGEDAFGFDAVMPIEQADEALSILGRAEWGADLVARSITALRQVALADGYLPAHVFDVAQRHFGENVCAVFDTGYFCTMGEHLWQAATPQACLMSGQGRYMGTSVPMAIAAALHHGHERPTLLFAGDGGIGPFLADVKIAVERQLPLLVCLLTDGGFGSIRTRALTDGLTQRPLIMADPSWRRVFDGFGFRTFTANDADAFASALDAWKPAEGPAYIECSFDPGAYEAMVKGIR